MGQNFWLPPFLENIAENPCCKDVTIHCHRSIFRMLTVVLEVPARRLGGQGRCGQPGAGKWRTASTHPPPPRTGLWLNNVRYVYQYLTELGYR